MTESPSPRSAASDAPPTARSGRRRGAAHFPSRAPLAALVAALALIAAGACDKAEEAAAPPPPAAPPAAQAPAQEIPPAIEPPDEVAFDFVAADFVDASTGWIVGVDEEAQVSAVVATADGGASWRKLVEIQGDRLRDVDFVNASTGWAVGDTGLVYRTGDGGVTWEAERVAAGEWAAQYESPSVTVGAGPRSPGVVVSQNVASIFFVDARVGWAAGDAPLESNPKRRRGLLLATNDGGTTWREVSGDAGPAVPHALNDVWFVDAKEGWAAGGDIEENELDVILRTADGGRTWTRAPSGVAQFPRAVHFVDHNRGWVVGMTIDLETGDLGPSKIVATSDAGATWTVQLVAPRSFFDVVFADASHGWAVGERSAVYATADGGATWRQQANFVTAGARQVPRPSVAAPRSGDAAGARRAPAPQPKPLGTAFFVSERAGWAGGAGVILRRAAR
jgi:photosystem II stability/assembly factor-like uncharacterized protein